MTAWMTTLDKIKAHGTGPLSPPDYTGGPECPMCECPVAQGELDDNGGYCAGCYDRYACHGCGAETERTDHKCEHCHEMAMRD